MRMITRHIFKNCHNDFWKFFCSLPAGITLLRYLLESHPNSTTDFFNRLSRIPEGLNFLLESLNVSPRFAQLLSLPMLTETSNNTQLPLFFKLLETLTGIQFLIGILQINTALFAQLRTWINQQINQRLDNMHVLTTALTDLTKSAEGLQLLNLLQINIPSKRAATGQISETDPEETRSDKAPRLQP